MTEEIREKVAGSPLSIPGDQKEGFRTLPASDSCADDQQPTNKSATVRQEPECS